THLLARVLGQSRSYTKVCPILSPFCLLDALVSVRPPIGMVAERSGRGGVIAWCGGRSRRWTGGGAKHRAAVGSSGRARRGVEATERTGPRARGSVRTSARRPRRSYGDGWAKATTGGCSTGRCGR